MSACGEAPWPARPSRAAQRKLLAHAAAWLRGVGIPVVTRREPAGCFFPGVWYEGSGLGYDPRTARIGDLMHDAGHLAVLPERVRRHLGVGSAFNPATRAERRAICAELYAAAERDEDHPLYWMLSGYRYEEAGATAWSLAACLAAGIDPRLVLDAVEWFELGGNGMASGAGPQLRELMLTGKHFGVMHLREIGIAGASGEFPTLRRWLA
jgi:hypothetical protein